MEMKLKSRPNIKGHIRVAELVADAPLKLSLLSLILIISAATNVDSSTFSEHPVHRPPVGPNQAEVRISPAPTKSSQQKVGTEVRDLHLTSELRAVKLRWSYEHSAANQPATFAVRYCEVTSWNLEIKCRQRDLDVEAPESNGDGRRSDESASRDEDTANSVIKAPLIDTVRQLEPPMGSLYEAYIYDLRALTNYTFQVRVARFAHESPLPSQVERRSHHHHHHHRSQSVARRLSLDDSALFPDSALAKRVETKPFGAEATKCLADVSEVIVNTGRFFGGRISVEDSNDPRCHLLGNRSSEQSSYLFRIDHELCGSKPVDGKRIGTMILVHENKDILTHNTARFLVLCNFLQKSFTLRASISLPKVNGMVAQSRSAVITSLPRRPLNVTGEAAAAAAATETVVARNEEQLRTAAPGEQHLLLASRKPTAPADANGTAAQQRAAASSQQLDELETNTIEKRLSSSPSSATASAAAVARQSKELQQVAVASSRRSSTSAQDSHHHARSLTLSSGASNKLVPQPVQVQSKVLYVERTEPSRIGRLHSDVSGGGGGNGSISSNISSSGGGNNNNRIAPYLPLTTQRSSQIDTSAPDKRRNSDATSERETTPTRNVKQQPASTTSLPSPTTTTTSTPPTTTSTTTTAKPIRADAASRDDELSTADLQSPSIIMTNNHRVAGDFLPVAQLAAPTSSNSRSPTSSSVGNEHSYSIKYSAAKVDDYPVARESVDDAVQLGAEIVGSQTSKVRSGRMRPVDTNESQQTASTGESPPTDRYLRHQPAWMVDNRMGEVLAGAEADLMAEPTNETSVVGRQALVNQTLAQNITGYLLKWSLKALTSLAKKSLESLAPADTNYSNETSELGEIAPSTTTNLPLIEIEQSRSSSESPEISEALPLTTTKKPVLSPPPTSMSKSADTRRTPVAAVNASAQVTSPPPAHPPSQPQSPSTSVQPAPAKVQEELQDGFLTSRRADAEKERPPTSSSATPSELPRPHPTRPANYSKSLDFSRNESSLIALRQKNSERGKVNASARHRTPPDHQLVNDDLGQLREGSPDSNHRDETSTFSSWPFYGVVLVVALALGVFFTFWLVSFPSSPRPTRLERNINTAIHPIAFNDAAVPVLVFNGPGGENGPGKSAHDISYQRYDYNKFENYSHEQQMRKNANLLTAAKVGLQSSQKSPSTSSQSTRSTSANSTILAGDENDCKNNEFLYTEHVLINTDSSFGESYA